MTIEQRSRVLRAMRAWLGLDQETIARLAEIGARSVLEAEKGRACSDRTWEALMRFYEARGLRWIEGSDAERGRIVISIV